MLKCSECNYSKSFNRRCVGIGASYGSDYINTEYICKHPESLDCIIFAGKTSPRNCPLKKKIMNINSRL